MAAMAPPIMMSGQEASKYHTNRPARIIPAEAKASFLQQINALMKFMSLCWCLYIMNATLVLPANDITPIIEIDLNKKVTQGTLGNDANDRPGKKEKVDASIFNKANQKDY